MVLNSHHVLVMYPGYINPEWHRSYPVAGINLCSINLSHYILLQQTFYYSQPTLNIFNVYIFVFWRCNGVPLLFCHWWKERYRNPELKNRYEEAEQKRRKTYGKTDIWRCNLEAKRQKEFEVTVGRNQGRNREVFDTKAHHETIVPWWKEAALNINTTVWQTCRKGLEEKKKKGKQEQGGSRGGQEGWDTERLCQSGPYDKQRHLVKPDRRSHRQMLCFFYDNDRPAKRHSGVTLLWTTIELKALTWLHASTGSDSPHWQRACCAISFNAGIDVFVLLLIILENVFQLIWSSVRIRLVHWAALHVGIR